MTLVDDESVLGDGLGVYLIGVKEIYEFRLDRSSLLRRDEANVVCRGAVTPIEAARGAAASVLMFYAGGGAFIGVRGSRCAAVCLCRYGVVVARGGRNVARQARTVASVGFAHCFQASRR